MRGRASRATGVTGRHTINELDRKEDGVLFEAAGLPAVGPGLGLPPDLRAFYECCGGLQLLRARIRIVGPERFLPVGEAPEGWYVLAESPDAVPIARLAIDLAPGRSGRCYDIAPDANGAPIVALSFTSVLNRLGRDGDFWAKAFVPLGDGRAA